MLMESALYLNDLPIGPSNLTVEALQQHNTSTSDDRALDSISDAGSIGGHSANTFKTWASNWTDCTNATFSKVHSRFNANSTEYQREVSSFSFKSNGSNSHKTLFVIVFYRLLQFWLQLRKS